MCGRALCFLNFAVVEQAIIEVEFDSGVVAGVGSGLDFHEGLEDLVF